MTRSAKPSARPSARPRAKAASSDSASPPASPPPCAESERLREAREAKVPWRKWGPYLSERQWGTVREDYSENGDAWSYFSHDQARSRAYRWGEDGLAGFSDDKQILCFALALWNGEDPILKERLFGLTNSEGNHGEDVKEYYFYLDATPTHSYMKYLYKYPHAAYPYVKLIEQNRKRTRDEPEYELIDTGVFEQDRYFDVFVEYAKESPEQLLVRITVHNRGPESAQLTVLPTLWFRNTWSWGIDTARPELSAIDGCVQASHAGLGSYTLRCEGAPGLLFTENDSNQRKLWNAPNERRWVKDAFHRHVVEGEAGAVNPAQRGTKAAARYDLTIEPHGQAVLRLTLSAGDAQTAPKLPVRGAFDDRVAARRAEADAFYAHVTPSSLSEDERRIHRQALSGMLWSKQYYYFDLDRWLKEHGAHPLVGPGKHARNSDWFHMFNGDVISMPDKWEYPWYAAWDLAFHTIALASVDFDFAKEQLLLMLRSLYCHPNGQIPAYEWNFSDVNPPVHAWATLYLYKYERSLGRPDLTFLARSFEGLLLNFNWWVNRKDPGGRNVFAGGFLGLDNIGVFDRSAPLPTGGNLEQADGTAWMAFFCQNMLEISLILTETDPRYEDHAFKFLQHFVWIAYAMDRIGEHHDEMWDEEDGFFYDVLRRPDGSALRLKVRSMVGLLPLCASSSYEARELSTNKRLAELVRLLRERHPDVIAQVAPTVDGFIGMHERRLLSIVKKQQLERVLGHLLDEQEFLSPYGIRSLSRRHLEHPFHFEAGGKTFEVAYQPGESTTPMFGGNSNWRGPIWMPVNALIIRSLLNMYQFYGDELKVECPTGSGKHMTLYEVAHELIGRLSKIFLRDERGDRPVFGSTRRFHDDPHFRDYVPFYEYFHGDSGAGLGASHQTGWTGVIATLIGLRERLRKDEWLHDTQEEALRKALSPLAE